MLVLVLAGCQHLPSLSVANVSTAPPIVSITEFPGPHDDAPCDAVGDRFPRGVAAVHDAISRWLQRDALVYHWVELSNPSLVEQINDFKPVIDRFDEGSNIIAVSIRSRSGYVIAAISSWGVGMFCVRFTDHGDRIDGRVTSQGFAQT
jgi:hypothetical protein